VVVSYCTTILRSGQFRSLVSVVNSFLGQIHWHSLQSTDFALKFFDSL
jgi:hypothetical protein